MFIAFTHTTEGETCKKPLLVKYVLNRVLLWQLHIMIQTTK